MARCAPDIEEALDYHALIFSMKSSNGKKAFTRCKRDHRLTETTVSCNTCYMPDRKQELSHKALAYFLEHGVADITLRPLAAKIGTSARLLVYHFGSKEGLFAAVFSEVELEVQAFFIEAFRRSSTVSEKRGLRIFWDAIIKPKNLRLFRLLFEIQVLTLRNPIRYANLLARNSQSWRELIQKVIPQSDRNRGFTTLCVAVVDGLLLELLSSGDRDRTKDAIEVFGEMLSDS